MVKILITFSALIQFSIARMDIVLMVHVKMEIGEISTDKTYVIVNLGDKKFILTLG